MNKISQLLSTETPLIAVGFADKTSSSVISDGVKHGVDVAELRIDLYSSFEHDYVLNEVAKYSQLPTIATIRLKDEGGKWHGTEQERLLLFKAIVPKVDAIDIELAATEILPEIVRVAKREDKMVFVSYHNFKSTPGVSELNDIAKKAKALGADLIKIATTAKNQKDLQTLASFTIENSKLGLVTISMGAKGVASRLFFPALGSRLTYAYVGQCSAPGQLTFDETFLLLRKLYPEFNQKKISDLELLEYA